MANRGSVAIHGVNMKYGSFGTGAERFVIIPGLSVNDVTDVIDLVEKQYAALCGRYTVYLFDRPDTVPADCTIEYLADCVAEGMRLLNIGRADVLGTSQGGMICQYLAAKYPERVNRAVICSSCLWANPTLTGMMAKWRGMARRREFARLAESFADDMYCEATLKACRDRMLSVIPEYPDDRIERFARLTESIDRFDARGVSEGIRAGTLIVGSTGDRVMGPNASPELARATGGDLYIYHDFGHALYDEAPDFTGRILEFMQA